MDFDSRYKQLNDAQRSAVDTIDGPVMVIAGPGTGKTELLGMRAANILRLTDAAPENILCLTFTEAGSIAMQKRLTSIIGRSAYNVSIFTFHAFGTEIISRYREYFYSGATFRPADDLARHRIITEILDKLDYNNPLRSTLNGKYTAIGDILTAMSDLKRAGLTNAEFGLLLDATQATTDIASSLLSDVFTPRISKSTLDSLTEALAKIETIEEFSPVKGIATLSETLVSSIQHAIDAASAHEKVTPPLTAWKKEWMTSDVDKSQILKIKKALPKLRALNYVYSLYLQVMQEAELMDYDDMIMQVVHTMEVNSDFRYDLQEKYQYIMVDEFQDTNLAQMRILQNLTDNPVVGDQPNILVVGDDDQAIYGFQGADVGNILQFQDIYPAASLVSLTSNYRSTQPILDSARDVIKQGTERLEDRLPTLNKALVSHSELKTEATEINAYATAYDERKNVAISIRQLLDNKTPAKEIAVIARKHSDLVSVISSLSDQNIPISYDRRDNVLDDEVVEQLEHVGKVVHAIATDQLEAANAMLPLLLSHPAWGIDPLVIWDISTTARTKHEQWLEVLRTHEATRELFTWLITCAQQSLHLPLERMLDVLIGNHPLADFTSHLKDYFFSEKAIDNDTASYTLHLENLTAIRTRLRDHIVDMTSPKLADFLDFISSNRETETRITSYRHIGEDSSSVQLLSAHGSKGLEFDHVFVIDAIDPMWGEKASGRSSTISFPQHLRLRQNTNDFDERLRLFYVAMTRARKGLHISYAHETDAAKEVLPASFIVGSSLTLQEQKSDSSAPAQNDAAEHTWYAPILNIPTVSMQQYLTPLLNNYKLSATHVNTFIDVIEGGPQHFLLNTILRFPQAPSAASSFGIAIHATLQRAHNHLRATKSLLPEEDILHEFELQLDRMPLTDDERQRYYHKGSDALRAFLKTCYAQFSVNQQAELDFRSQEVRIDDICLTGMLDVVEFNKDERTAIVTDYKTGGALHAWDKGADYQKVKAHKYRQQLLFYKLLIENSRDWHNYTMKQGILQFVEPDAGGNIVNLALEDIPAEELDRFKNLVAAVWKHITEQTFPDTSNYDGTLEGIRKFEDDLINGLI